MTENSLYYTTFKWQTYDIVLAKTTKGLCFVDVTKDNQGFTSLQNWKKKYAPNFLLTESSLTLAKEQAELQHYLIGKQKELLSPLDLYGTSFQQDVWSELRTIPYGTVTTYSAIAEKLNKPKAVRAVANAIGQNSLLFFVPCHRVIRKDGSLSSFRAGISLKKQLLQLEGKL